MKFLIVIFLMLFVSCSVGNKPQRKQFRMLRKDMMKDDTSYVYSLPFKKGRAFLIVQGYYGIFSHQQRAALDFKMKRGTKICAARGGVVVRVKEDSDKGGWNKKYS